MSANPFSFSFGNAGSRPQASIRNLHLNDPEQRTSLASGIALVLLGCMGRSSLLKLALTLTGASMIHRVLTHRGGSTLDRDNPARHRTRGGGVADQKGLKIIQLIAIDRPREEVYQYWRDPQNLPKFMRNVESVHTVDDRHAHWVYRTPLGNTVEWYTEIFNEHPNEMIAWQSLPGADIPNAGSVRFDVAPDGKGTLIKVALEYEPPSMQLGGAIADVFGGTPEQQLAEDLARLKFLLEAGPQPDPVAEAEAATL